MIKEKHNEFNWRGFVSIITGLSFVAMSITGIILFVVPPGRIANWTDWRIFALTKHQWIALHIWFSTVFMVAAFAHIYLNWKPLVNYFKNKLAGSFALRAEWILSLLICLVIAVGTLAEIRPFSSLVDWNEAIKHGWDTADSRAPIPHAELLTLEQLVEQVKDIDVETMVANLKAAGIEVKSPSIVVGELARANGISPIALYNIAVGSDYRQGRRGRGPAGQRQRTGHEGTELRAVGQMTLESYCIETGLDIDKAVEKLKKAGLQAGPEMTIRRIADSGGLHPSEVRSMLE